MTEHTTESDNVAKTLIELMRRLGNHADIAPADPKDEFPHLITVPEGRRVEDLTAAHRAVLEYFKPLRRRGTAELADLDSFIAWANRFKGATSALFANPDMTKPALTCIADYHAAGPVELPENHGTGDPTARHCAHRGVYRFPLSDEWKRWAAISGNPLEKDEMGEFIEANARDFMDPTPAVLKGDPDDDNADWENRLIAMARQIEGRFGQLGQLLQMSRRFQVFETSDLTVSTNRDTGEAQIQFLNEHKDADGAPLRVPNLVIIAIPVFQGGALYRMAVRFRYRKAGPAVKFTFSIYNPERAFDAALREALDAAEKGTELPLFVGTPES